MAADVRVELQEPVAGSKVIYSKSAVNGRGLSIGLDSSRTLDIEINGMEDRKLEVYALDDNHDFTHFNETYLHGNILTLEKERCSSSAYLLVFE